MLSALVIITIVSFVLTMLGIYLVTCVDDERVMNKALFVISCLVFSVSMFAWKVILAVYIFRALIKYLGG